LSPIISKFEYLKLHISPIIFCVTSLLCLCDYTVYRFQVIGLENLPPSSEPVIYVPNHTSVLDILGENIHLLFYILFILSNYSIM